MIGSLSDLPKGILRTSDCDWWQVIGDWWQVIGDWWQVKGERRSGGLVPECIGSLTTDNRQPTTAHQGTSTVFSTRSMISLTLMFSASAS